MSDAFTESSTESQQPPPSPGGNGPPPAEDHKPTAPKDCESEVGHPRLIEIAGKIEANQANQVMVANEISMICMSGEGRARKFSLEHFEERLDGEGLQRAKRRLFYEREDVEPIVQRLEQRPLLVLAGENGVGKTSLAVAAVGLLRERGRAPVEEVLVCRRLESNIRVNFHTITQEEPKLCNRGLIFALAAGCSNADILRFFSSLTGDRLDVCLDRLRRSGAFLILTTDREAIPGEVERLRGLGVLYEVSTPSADTLCEGLRHLALHACREGEQDLAQRAESLIAGEGERIAAELQGMSWIATFVREYLPQILDGRLQVEDALRRLKDLSRWMLDDLPEDIETWCAVLSLTLCSAARRFGGVPWLQFETLRRDLLRLAQREMGRRRPRRSLTEVCRGRFVLQRARIEVEPGTLSDGDIVRFSAEMPRAEERLWEVLLGPGREVTATLVPLLRNLTQGEDIVLAQLAASALGRIGQIDPIYVILPRIEEWTRRRDGEKGGDRGALIRGTLLGYLYRGILGARERDLDFYADTAFQHLCAQFRSDSVEAVRTVLIALVPIATYDARRFGFAMSLLREAAAKWLTPQWDDLREIADMGRRGEHALRFFEKVLGRSGSVEEIQKLIDRTSHGAVVAENAWPVFRAFQYTLSGLFFSVLTQRVVLEHLRQWSREDEKKLGPLLAYVFLRPDGIGSMLARMASTKSPASDADEGSPFLESLHTDPEMIEVLGGFLEQTYVHLRAFPGRLRLQLEDGFVRLLAGWAREARSTPRLRPDIVDLLSGLFEARDEELSERVLRFAQEPPPLSPDHQSTDLHDLHQIAIEAVTRPPRRRMA